MTDAEGSVVTRMSYTPYGEKVKSACTGLDIFNHKYTGQVDDTSTGLSAGSSANSVEDDGDAGLLYYNARYYDPYIGRFISADSMIPDPTESQSFNRYMYVIGNPVTYNDPTGHVESNPEDGGYHYENSGGNPKPDGGGVHNGGSTSTGTTSPGGSDTGCTDPSTESSTTHNTDGTEGTHASSNTNGHNGGNNRINSTNNYGITLYSAVNGDFGVDYKTASYAAYQNNDYFNGRLNAVASFSEFAYDSLLTAYGVGLISRLVSGVVAVDSAVATVEIKLLNQSINITQKGWNHVYNRHISLSSFVGKSKFAQNINIKQLIQNATQMPMIKQTSGNFARIVDAGSQIGFDSRTGLSTSIYTVITNASGDLITAFPGLP